MTKIKICGLTNLDDARGAWRAGADLLGFILVPASPRYVLPRCVCAIATDLRDEGCTASLVGVFAATPTDEIRQVAQQCGLDRVQLHGDGDMQGSLAKLGAPAIVARRVRDRCDWETWVCPGAWAILLDRYHPQRLGGSGQVWDWALYQPPPPTVARVILAGGLAPENVADAIAAVHPWGVDVSSGVETAPGRKDLRRIEQLIRAVREVEA